MTKLIYKKNSLVNRYYEYCYYDYYNYCYYYFTSMQTLFFLDISSLLDLPIPSFLSDESLLFDDNFSQRSHSEETINLIVSQSISLPTVQGNLDNILLFISFLGIHKLYSLTIVKNKKNKKK